ncbi:hypothetical protein M8C21_030692 [Ambrosia artemisiifolia]|uniref:Uncharacterized protein n=1 Tax=Ambrosia artemisiifolia TaxID=4212 RepID=A0AAD5C1W2_AMBAR|nr:hypothetical protein M8C21_030692 [Ambrosia artemisiifolia]
MGEETLISGHETAMSVLFLFADLAMNMKEERGIKPAISSRPDSSELKVLPLLGWMESLLNQIDSPANLWPRVQESKSTYSYSEFGSQSILGQSQPTNGSGQTQTMSANNILESLQLEHHMYYNTQRQNCLAQIAIKKQFPMYNLNDYIPMRKFYLFFL